jgi:U3 small nucleolar ribonucleoprotein protein IMP4
LKGAESSKILITTSRNPTQTIRTFCSDLTHSIPNSLRANRGKSSLDSLAEKALEYEAGKVIICDRWKGGLGKIQLFEVGNGGLVHFDPLMYIKKVKLRRTFEHVRRKAFKSLTLLTGSGISFEAHKLADALSRFFNIPKLTADETLSPNTQTAMHISFDAAFSIRITFLQTPRKVEVGPRVTISHLIWRSQK